MVDVTIDILPLSSLVVKRHSMEREREENDFDVWLGAAGYADVEVRTTQINKLLDKFKHGFTGGWCANVCWEFVQRVDCEVNWILSLNIEHFFETFCNFVVAWLPQSAVAFCITLEKNVVVDVGLITELNKQG